MDISSYLVDIRSRFPNRDFLLVDDIAELGADALADGVFAVDFVENVTHRSN
ncbi:MAG: hypothetical protein WBM25_14300 [Azonexus sp.]|jgi:hypothetical protein